MTTAVSCNSWSLPPEVQQYIAEHVHDGSRTLETGAGASTVLFALCGATHTCITPIEQKSSESRNTAATMELPLAKVDFQFDRSDNVLMRSALSPSPSRSVGPDADRRLPRISHPVFGLVFPVAAAEGRRNR